MNEESERTFLVHFPRSLSSFTFLVHQLKRKTFDMPNLQKLIAPLFIRRLVQSGRGRAYVLNQAADAESSDEGQIFEEILSLIDDPKVHKLVKIHQEDEERHAALFLDAAKRIGVPLQEVPEHLKLLAKLDVALGGFFEQFKEGKRGLMDIYLLLQVIEERATTQFRQMEPEMRKVDPAAADMLLGIAEDEVRHLKYCRAISKQYAPSPEVLEATLSEFREVEARVFGEHSRANMENCLDQELANLSPAETFFWRAVLRASKRNKFSPPTDFAPEVPGFFETHLAKVRAMAN